MMYEKDDEMFLSQDDLDQMLKSDLRKNGIEVTDESLEKLGITFNKFLTYIDKTKNNEIKIKTSKILDFYDDYNDYMFKYFINLD